MLKSFFDKLENPKRPLLGPNYWLLTKTGVFLPKAKIGKLLCLLLQLTAIISSTSAIYELYLVRSNRDTALNNLKNTILGFICIAKAYSFIIWQNHWKKVLEYVTQADNYERQTRDDTKGKIIDQYTKYCRKITYWCCVLIFTTMFIAVITPIIAVMSKERRQNIRNGTEPFPHIFSNWVPFDKNSFPGNCITVIYHVILVAWGTAIMTSTDTTILVSLVFFRGKLELLRERCKHMLGTDGKGIPEGDADKVIGDLHHTHVMLLKNMQLFNSLISPVMFTYVVVCSLMIFASALQFVSATTMVQRFLLMEYLVFAVAQLFLFCWHSSEVLEKNEQLMLGPYESQWWTAKTKQRKSIMILAGQFSIVHAFTAGPFNNLTLSMFVSVLKGAYSYFTLVRE